MVGYRGWDSVLPTVKVFKLILGASVHGTIVLCRNMLFEVTGYHSPDEAKLLADDEARRSKGKLDYLKFRQGLGDAETTYERMPVPENVRNEVWRRDQGKCVICGSVRDLEFDHIIPVTKGGSNTARNIQLLCEPCNRQKSNHIG
jgi:5-methylcytosine-specific restriction endonuclease McrA